MLASSLFNGMEGIELSGADPDRMDGIEGDGDIQGQDDGELGIDTDVPVETGSSVNFLRPVTSPRRTRSGRLLK